MGKIYIWTNSGTGKMPLPGMIAAVFMNMFLQTNVP
jgi:hypothetical protein